MLISNIEFTEQKMQSGKNLNHLKSDQKQRFYILLPKYYLVKEDKCNKFSLCVKVIVISLELRNSCRHRILKHTSKKR
jgi:hypothetical protein